jgi:hypothetical protein
VPCIRRNDGGKFLLEERVGPARRLRDAIEEIAEEADTGDAGVTEIGDDTDGELPGGRPFRIVRVPALDHVCDYFAPLAQALERWLHPLKSLVEARAKGLQFQDSSLDVTMELPHVLAGMKSPKVKPEVNRSRLVRGQIASPRVCLADQHFNRFERNGQSGGRREGASEPPFEVASAAHCVPDDLG